MVKLDYETTCGANQGIDRVMTCIYTKPKRRFNLGESLEFEQRNWPTVLNTLIANKQVYRLIQNVLSDISRTVVWKKY